MDGVANVADRAARSWCSPPAVAWPCSKRSRNVGRRRRARRLSNRYGLSETSPCATTNPPAATAFSGTVGLPLPSTGVPLGQQGEICIRGPQGMAGYWNRPDETARAMTPYGFFRPGDVGLMNEAGFVRIVDRRKDMVLVSGFNVYPNEIGDVVAKRPGVFEVVAASVPDEQTGEGGQAVCRQARSCAWRNRYFRFLQGIADRLQAAQDHRVSDRAAEDECRQNPAAGLARRGSDEGVSGLRLWSLKRVGSEARGRLASSSFARFRVHLRSRHQATGVHDAPSSHHAPGG